MKNLTINQTLFDDFIVLTEHGIVKVSGQNKLKEFVEDYFDIELDAECEHVEQLRTIEQQLEDMLFRVQTLRKELVIQQEQLKMGA